MLDLLLYMSFFLICEFCFYMPIWFTCKQLYVVILVLAPLSNNLSSAPAYKDNILTSHMLINHMFLD